MDLKILKICLFLAIIFITCTTASKSREEIRGGDYPKNEEYAHKKQELSLEVSEKYYKKAAILKFNDGVENFEKGNVKEAILLFEEAIKEDKSIWVAYLGLGQAYEKDLQYEKSLRAYKRFLELAPKAAIDRDAVTEKVKFLSHILRHGENVLKGEDYLQIVKTKHAGKELYVRWDLNKPIKIYFFPAKDVPVYKKEFEEAFISGASIWKEVLPKLELEVVDNSKVLKLPENKAKKVEEKILEDVQVKVVFPSRFKIKGDPNNPLARELDAYSFPIIRDKKNFRVLGVVMISPYIYFQSQIAIPLEALAKLEDEEQINKIKIIAAREFGHTLGLWGYSPNPDDLMFEGEVNELKLSERDKATIRKLYELDPEKVEILTNN